MKSLLTILELAKYVFLIMVGWYLIRDWDLDTTITVRQVLIIVGLQTSWILNSTKKE